MPENPYQSPEAQGTTNYPLTVKQSKWWMDTIGCSTLPLLFGGFWLYYAYDFHAASPDLDYWTVYRNIGLTFLGIGFCLIGLGLLIRIRR